MNDSVEPSSGKYYALADDVRSAFTETGETTPELQSLQSDLFRYGLGGEARARLMRMDSAAARATEGEGGAVSRAEALAKAFGLKRYRGIFLGRLEAISGAGRFLEGRALRSTLGSLREYPCEGISM